MAEEHSLTEFNSNLATLQRIDSLLRLCSDSHYSNDLASYFKLLRNLKKEIIVKMRNDIYKPDKDETEKLYEELVNLYQFYLSNPSEIKLNRLFERKLNQFEDKLRDFADLKGMLLRDTYDDDGL